MSDPKNNGENYEGKNRWVWAGIIIIAISSIYVMSLDSFIYLSNSLNLL